MESRVEWQRVNRNHPCAICGKIDWCTYTDQGACCMRTESSRSMANGGYFHPLSSDLRSSPLLSSARLSSHIPSTPLHSKYFADLITRWRREKAGQLESYAALLGVGWQDLDDLHACWSPEFKAFAYPMCNADGDVVGIRLRNDFHKWSVKGGHQGCFVPHKAIRRLPITTVLIVEGPTDCAAGLCLGYFTIGRPNNMVGNDIVAAVLNELRPRDVIVAFDNDEHYDSMGKLVRPGPFGAERLIKTLKHRVTRFVPPTKDLRSFLQSGGTHDDIQSVLRTSVRT